MQKRKRDTNDDGYSSEIILVEENSRQESITVDDANPSRKSAENNLQNVLKTKSHKSAHSKRLKRKGPAPARTTARRPASLQLASEPDIR